MNGKDGREGMRDDFDCRRLVEGGGLEKHLVWGLRVYLRKVEVSCVKPVEPCDNNANTGSVYIMEGNGEV